MNETCCTNCICVPVCLNKSWKQLIKCPLLRLELATASRSKEKGQIAHIENIVLKRTFTSSMDNNQRIYFGCLDKGVYRGPFYSY